MGRVFLWCASESRKLLESASRSHVVGLHVGVMAALGAEWSVDALQVVAAVVAVVFEELF